MVLARYAGKQVFNLMPAERVPGILPPARPTVSRPLAPKVAFYMAMRESKVNNSQLARKVGVSETFVRRMLNPRRHSKPERMDAALEALGKRIQLMVEDAARRLVLEERVELSCPVKGAGF